MHLPKGRTHARAPSLCAEVPPRNPGVSSSGQKNPSRLSREWKRSQGLLGHLLLLLCRSLWCHSLTRSLAKLGVGGGQWALRQSPYFLHTHPPVLSYWKEQMQMDPKHNIHNALPRFLGAHSKLELGSSWGLTFSLVQTSVPCQAWRKVREPVTATSESSEREEPIPTGSSHLDGALGPTCTGTRTPLPAHACVHADSCMYPFTNPHASSSTHTYVHVYLPVSNNNTQASVNHGSRSALPPSPPTPKRGCRGFEINPFLGRRTIFPSRLQAKSPKEIRLGERNH